METIRREMSLLQELRSRIASLEAIDQENKRELATLGTKIDRLHVG